MFGLKNELLYVHFHLFPFFSGKSSSHKIIMQLSSMTLYLNKKLNKNLPMTFLEDMYM